eukprot:Pgem_evm1s6684
MPKIKKGARVYVLAEHFGHDWCKSEGLDPKRKLNGVVARKFKEYSKVKMDIDDSIEEVDNDKICFYGIAAGDYSDYVNKRQRKQKNRGNNASLADNSKIEASRSESEEFSTFHGQVMSRNLKEKISSEINEHILASHESRLCGKEKRRPRFRCIACSAKGKEKKVATYCSAPQCGEKVALCSGECFTQHIARDLTPMRNPRGRKRSASCISQRTGARRCYE